MFLSPIIGCMPKNHNTNGGTITSSQSEHYARSYLCTSALKRYPITCHSFKGLRSIHTTRSKNHPSYVDYVDDHHANITNRTYKLLMCGRQPLPPHQGLWCFILPFTIYFARALMFFDGMRLWVSGRSRVLYLTCVLRSFHTISPKLKNHTFNFFSFLYKWYKRCLLQYITNIACL